MNSYVPKRETLSTHLFTVFNLTTLHTRDQLNFHKSRQLKQNFVRVYRYFVGFGVPINEQLM